MSDKYVLICGNLIDGAVFVGPFEDYEEAQEYAQGDYVIKNNDWMIATLFKIYLGEKDEQGI